MNNHRTFMLVFPLAIILLSALPLVPRAHATTTCTFTTAGTTMTLDANCTTDATITIPDGFTLDGAGHTITANDPPLGHFLGAVVMNAGTTAHVKNLIVTASGLADVCDAGADRLRGILFDGAGGSITGNTVLNINQGTSGCQEGNGIEVRNAPFDGTHPATMTVTISGNTVTNYQKNGITANGDVFAIITGNTVTGAGKVNYIAQNGIQVGFGGTGAVIGNSISSNFYTGCSNKDAAKTGCTPFVAAGLLMFDVVADSILRADNRYRGNQFNVLLVNSQSVNPGP